MEHIIDDSQVAKDEEQFYSKALEEIKFFLRDKPEEKKFLLENKELLMETFEILHSNRSDLPFNECAEVCLPIYESGSIQTVRSYNQFLRTCVDNGILLIDDVIEDFTRIAGYAGMNRS